MRPRLLKWLVCPCCQGDLLLKAAKFRDVILSKEDKVILEASAGIHSPEEVGSDIITGALTCDNCKYFYPIHAGVPRMLTYSTKVGAVFVEENEQWINENLKDYALPNLTAPHGEQEVLRNFSQEWTNYEWTGESYWDTTPENMLRCMQYVLGASKYKLENKLLLEVGIGIGGIADALSRNENCEIVGMDLGYAVDQAMQFFRENQKLHIVQASIFAPPFRPNTFDTVYSQGVIHHTYSTYEAFTRIAKLPKLGEGRLYIWVYSKERERATKLRRALMAIENISRPLIAKLPVAIQTLCLIPAIPGYLFYQNYVRMRQRGTLYTARYGWNEALHAARDRLTPPFAHRHTYEEIAEWFIQEKYFNLEFLRDEKAPNGVPDAYSMNVGIRGARKLN